MKVLHVIPSLSPTQGGPSVALPLMERALRAERIEVVVATTDDAGRGARIDVALGRPLSVNGATRYYFRKQTEFYKYSSPLARWLDGHVAGFDVVHVHALFSHASVAGARAARRHGVPYIFRPLGVLNRYGMTQRRARLKRLSFRWLERPLLQGAALLHYTSQQEKIEAEELGELAPGVVLPLGIDVEALQGTLDVKPFLTRWPRAIDQQNILYLSRLDPKKGLELLIGALAKVKASGFQALLVIAGAGEREYVAELERLVARQGLTSEVLWVGHLSGELKRAAFGVASVFILPSKSENFGLAAIEALAVGTPTILTQGVGISEAVGKEQAGLVVESSTDAIAEAILRVLSDRDFAASLTAKARALARERYSLKAMGTGLRELYERAMRLHIGAA